MVLDFGARAARRKEEKIAFALAGPAGPDRLAISGGTDWIRFPMCRLSSPGL